MAPPLSTPLALHAIPTQCILRLIHAISASSMMRRLQGRLWRAIRAFSLCHPSDNRGCRPCCYPTVVLPSLGSGEELVENGLAHLGTQGTQTQGTLLGR